MAVTNQLGIRNSNTIIPYSGATRRTKELALALTTDITCPQTGFAIGICKAVFFADSTGNWWVTLSSYFTWNSATVTDVTITFNGVTFVTNQGFAAALAGLNAYARMTTVTNTLLLACDSTAGTAGVRFTTTISLAAEPLAYTIAANMEGVVAVDVFVPSAAAGIQGLVDNRVANTLGTPILGKTDGAAVAAGYVGETIVTTQAAGISITNGNTTVNFSTDFVTPTISLGKYLITVCGVVRKLTNAGTGGAFAVPVLVMANGAGTALRTLNLAFIPAGVTSIELHDTPFNMSFITTITSATVLRLKGNNNILGDKTCTLSISDSEIIIHRIA